MIGIGVEAGEKCQIGALSVVPKHSRLDGGAIYAGVPVRRIEKGVTAAQAATETG
jgi:carbonic anhydrase/acetyltransferase-like protein (isoleucine patch superfamily)